MTGMSLVQEATDLMERMPIRNQQIVVDLLRMMDRGTGAIASKSADIMEFRRTGKSNFHLPADFDEHFDDMNDEIAAMFKEESV